ncbi:hypothetical protein [Bdellovibrio sp. BCCA]|uniref:hypothetical protein n=1 Tax=Bdellovibrio sp. BCCA TaxID=3136281 RepID=UPI0030EFC48A
MKKLLLALLSVTVIMTTGKAQAGFIFESKWTEPVLLSVAASVLAVAAAPKGSDPMQVGGIGAAVGFGIGWGINSYYESKYESRYISEMNKLDKTIQQYRIRDAQRAASKDMTTRFGVIKQEVVPAQDLGNGQISSPYIIETHTTPDNSDADFIGE